MTIILQALLEAAITAEYGDTPARAELELKIGELNTVILAKDAAYAALQTELDGVRQANATLGEANRQLQLVIDSLKAQSVDAQEMVFNQAKTIDGLIKENEALEARIKELEAGSPPIPPEEPEEPPPPPPASGFEYKGLQTVWPNAVTTGPRVPITTTRAGGNISGTFKATRFTGQIRPAAGTVLEDCVVDGLIDGDGKKFTLDHCRVDGKGGPYCILGTVTALWCDIFNGQDAIKTQGDGWSIKYCYIHGPTITASSHNDGIQIQWRNTNGVIEGNRIQWADTSEVFFQVQDGEPISNHLIRWNWLGGSDLPLRIETGCTNMQARENVIKRGNWGYYDLISSVQKSGNIDSVTGAAI